MKFISLKKTIRSLVGGRGFATNSSESDVLRLLNSMSERLRILEDRGTAADTLMRIIELRSSKLESLLRIVEERSNISEPLLRLADERSRTIESLVRDIDSLARVVEARSRTLEYDGKQVIHAGNYQISQLQRMYVEAMPSVLHLSQRSAFNASKIIELKTDHPIAVGSNDHIIPDSTTEGVSRPTLFVQNCISLMGSNLRVLDLGTGAAGLVFEFAMNDVLAIGVDGSDFCRKNKIGYWPLLGNNLFTCDITKKFDFKVRENNSSHQFGLVTMWEVLEHIDEFDLPNLFENIGRHLTDNGYFIGSISLVEYRSEYGEPYHVTLKPREWWQEKFLVSGLVMLEQHPFNENWFYRGNGPRFQDFHNYSRNPDEGFLFVARKREDWTPNSA